MATTIEQQVAPDEALVPSTQRLRIGQSNFRLPLDIQSKESTLQVVYDVLHRSPFFKAFLVTADVPEIYIQEFWATAYVHQHSIRFKMDTRNNIVDLEAFREMLHIRPRISGTPRLITYKEYYACATREAAPKPKASARRKRGGFASSTTPPTPIPTPTPITTVVAAPRLTPAAIGKHPARATSPTDPSDVERTEAEQLKIVLRRSRQETHISQQGGSSIDKGTGSKPRVPNVPSDDSEEEISWNSSDDEDVNDQTKGRDDKEDDQDEAKKVNGDDDDEEEISKIDEQKATESGEGDDEVTKSDGKNEEEETREEAEESFDLIPRTPEDSEDDGNNEEDQGLRISEEERRHEEEEAYELYCDTDRLQDSLQRENDEFLRTIDDNMKKIIKEQAEVLTRSSHSSRTSYAVAADLLEMELKKILIDKMEGNKREDDDDQEGPFAGSDRGSKRGREGGEHASANTPSEPATTSVGKSTTGTQSRLMSASESAFAEEPEPLNYDKHALWGVSHWGRKRQQFYGFAFNRESALDVYSKRRITAATDLKIVEWHNYKHLYWISGIRMQYLPTTIWRKWDKDRAAAMTQAIDKMLKTRRIMRSLE
nr:hypothetical protein [Tanacetum cinerariifolium]